MRKIDNAFYGIENGYNIYNTNLITLSTCCYKYLRSNLYKIWTNHNNLK